MKKFFEEIVLWAAILSGTIETFCVTMIGSVCVYSIAQAGDKGFWGLRIGPRGAIMILALVVIIRVVSFAGKNIKGE